MKYLLLVAMLFAANVQAKQVTFNCDFPLASDDEHGPKSQNFKFDIRYDTVTQEAVILGNQGHAELIVITGNQEQFTVIEIVPLGSLMSTTIALPSYKAVHSRHTVVVGMGTMAPSQHYGTCMPKRN